MPKDFNADSRLAHLDADTDTSITAIHHTLGPSPTQASPGTHVHDGTDSYKIKVTDLDGTLTATNGLPVGGTANQVLSKIDSTNYNAQWVDTASYTSVIKHPVKLGEAISKGQAVYVSSANGTNMIVSKADNTSEATSSKTMGLLETGGNTNAFVNVITEGLLSGLNTSTATAGDPVWLGTAGNLIYGLANKPHAPAHLVFIGVVTRVNANNGEIFIRPQNGPELNEIHNVDTGTTNTLATGDVLSYDASVNLWYNKTLAQAGIVGTSDSRLTDSRTPTAHASTHASAGSDPVTLAPSQVTGTAVITTDSRLSDTRTPTAASVVDASINASGLSPSKITGTAVITTDSRLSNARTPTTHASTHASGGSDAITIAPAQVTGTAVVTADSRLSDARTPLSHTHGNISNGGAVSTSVTATNPVKVLITDTSNIAGTLTTTGATNTTFLRGDGTWSTPSGGSAFTAIYTSNANISNSFPSSTTAISIFGGTATPTLGYTVSVDNTYEYEFYGYLQQTGAVSTQTPTWSIGSTTVTLSPVVAHVTDFGFTSNTTGLTTASTLSKARTTTGVAMTAITTASRYYNVVAKGIIRVTGTGTVKIYPALSATVSVDNVWSWQAGTTFKLTSIGNGTVTTVGTWS